MGGEWEAAGAVAVAEAKPLAAFLPLEATGMLNTWEKEGHYQEATQENRVGPRGY